MMKTSLLRQVRLYRAALSAASRVQIASQPFPSASTLLSSIPRTLSAPCRTASGPLLRLYSSTAEAPIQDDKASRVTKFENLTQLGVNERIIRNIVEDMGYKDMTDVQSMTINAALDGKDLVAQAKTGTGKTLAFLVPIIQRIIAQSPELAGGNRSARFAQPARSDDIRAIIVSPTRELAEQIAAEAKRLVRGTGIKVQCAVGGTRKRSMLLEAQRYGCHLLVATPGRLNDLLSDPTSRIAAPNLQALVLDEADRMLDQGFQKDLDAIVDMLPDRREVPRQTLLFSATIPHNVISLARTYINEQNFDFVQTVSPDDVATHERVPQHIVPCRGFENVFPTLLELIEKESAEAAADPTAPPFKAIVFLQTTASVVLMHSMFQRIAFHNRSLPQAFDIHSKLGQSQRTHNAQKFRSSTSSVLFSSDVTARGMDFPNVTHVIQVHLPISRDQYIHRVGRTGRAGKGGEGWLIVADMEVPLARRRLQGLPIKRSTDLVCATADVTAHSQELPDQFAAIKEAVSRLPPHLIRETYTSLLGGALAGNDPQSIVDEVNNMALHSWGLPEIPAVTPNMARNLGRVKGLRVESLPPRDHAFGHGRTGGFGSGRGSPVGGRLDRIFGSDDRRGGVHRGSHGGRDRGFGGRDDGYRGRGRSHDGPSF